MSNTNKKKSRVKVEHLPRQEKELPGPPAANIKGAAAEMAV